jgi:MCP family monocarboxylic acid transporter-like MFS transporter 14
LLSTCWIELHHVHSTTSCLWHCVIVKGIGFGLIYVPSIITVGFYFEKWRALATGIGVCGSGIGTFMFAPITTALIESLGWRTALLCQGAIVFSSVVFGLLYR